MSDELEAGGEHSNRYSPRMAVEVLLSYRRENAVDDEGRVARTKTLGLGGLMFLSDTPFELDGVYLLDLVFGEEKMSFRGKVVYSLPAGEDGFEVGFSFQDLTDKQREELTGFFIQEYEKLPPENF
jgi:hypothetical protein